MKRGISLGIILTTCALSATACGDDSGGGGGNGDDEENVECTPGAGGACQNETDCVVVRNGDARLSARTCGLGCQQDLDPGACAVTCMLDDIDISQECASCYAALVACATMYCVQDCGADPSSAECTQCQIDNGCRGPFDSCSGLVTVP